MTSCLALLQTILLRLPPLRYPHSHGLPLLPQCHERPKPRYHLQESPSEHNPVLESFAPGTGVVGAGVIEGGGGGKGVGVEGEGAEEH